MSIKKKLVTMMAGAMLMTSGVAGTANLMIAHSAVAQAATVGTRVTVKRNAKLYQIKLNKNKTKVVSVKKFTKHGRQLAIRGGKSRAFWSVKQGKTTYYYLGNQMGKMLAVRSQDTKHAKSVPSLAKFIKQNTKTENRNIQIPIKHVELDSLAVPAKVTTEAIYGVVGTDNKVQNATDKLPVGTQINVLFKVPGVFSSNKGNTEDGYYAKMGDKTIILPVNTTDLAEVSVPDQTTYQNNLAAKDKEYVQKQVQEYKEAHNLK